MEWYENKTLLAGAIEFLMKYNCCFGWTAFASDKTLCCDYREVDNDIPEGLRQALRRHLKSLKKENRRDFNRKIAMLLGERFYVREATILKILSRVLADGDPRQNKEIIAFSLEMQLKKRMELLKTLK